MIGPGARRISTRQVGTFFFESLAEQGKRDLTDLPAELKRGKPRGPIRPLRPLRGNPASHGHFLAHCVRKKSSGRPQPDPIIPNAGITVNQLDVIPGGVVNTAAVPEASTWVMGLLALGAVAFMVRRSNAKASI